LKGRLLDDCWLLAGRDAVPRSWYPRDTRGLGWWRIDQGNYLKELVPVVSVTNVVVAAGKLSGFKLHWLQYSDLFCKNLDNALRLLTAQVLVPSSAKPPALLLYGGRLPDGLVRQLMEMHGGYDHGRPMFDSEEKYEPEPIRRIRREVS
jgi:hypothetical protein